MDNYLMNTRSFPKTKIYIFVLNAYSNQKYEYLEQTQIFDSNDN